ncbi:MAG: hypothetical protein H6506_01195 [Calditrichaeota bacterium]|nr:hypothetical protein [Calditrichota bacterium]MCB9366495.1 hypothetical protein [Calditrichota bacterium]MCB9391247.1 hypothetical protein [Calditrichota bacterium]
MTKFLVFCTFLLLAVPAWAQLEDIELDGSNQLRFDDGREVDTQRAGLEHPDNTIRRHFIENRLLLNLFSGDFHLGGRFLYFRPAEADVDQFRLADENRFDKRFFEGKIAPFDFRFGHFSDLWGSGLVFSAFENRDLYFDSELDGARVQLNAGSIKLIGATGTTEDGPLVPEMKATAGRVELSPGKGRRLGFSYVYHDSLSNPEMGVAGVDWNITRGILNLYGERAWNEAVLAGGNSAGHATFAGLTLSKWGWSLLAEYADYDYRINTPIQNPPTTHREVGPRLLQGREPHVLNIADEVGVQVELNGSVGENTYVTAHYNASSRHSDEDESVPLPALEEKYRPYWEVFANADHTFGGGEILILEVGANEEAAVVWQERKWGQVRFKFHIRGDQELELETEQLLITDRTRDDEKFHDMLYGVSWVPSHILSLNASVQFTDDEELKKREGEFWAGGEVAMQLAGGKHRAILFYGSERGGLKCSNGVCRQVQAFSGLRFTLETSL